jgi:preprotein translocase subunit SecB
MEENATINDTENSQEFKVERLYTKNISLETANNPAIFQQTWQPEIKLELNVTTQPLAIENQHEVTIAITITAKSDQGLLYLGKVQQAGVFSLKQFTEEQQQSFLNSVCASLLYPYAGERLSNLITYSGFPPLHLVPINFNHLYAQRKQAALNTADKSMQVQ